MKIREGGDEPDIFGEYPAAWVEKAKNLQEIWDWLFKNYNGSKFAIIFDATKDEYQELTATPVYFLDCVFNELLEYMGIDKAKEWIAKKEGKR